MGSSTIWRLLVNDDGLMPAVLCAKRLFDEDRLSLEHEGDGRWVLHVECHDEGELAKTRNIPDFLDAINRTGFDDLIEFEVLE